MSTDVSHRPDARPVTASARTVYVWGFRLSAAILLAGIAVAIIRQEPLASELGTPNHVVTDAIHGHCNGIVGLGILAMILTPLVGAISMVASFLRIGDRQFALFALAIVIILCASIAYSLA